MSKTYIAKGKYGKGVFAGQNLKKGELVHVAPAIKLSKGDMYFVENTVLNDYVYAAASEFDSHCWLAWGHGSLFNHADKENIHYEVVEDKSEIHYFAKKNVKKDEELFINYGWDV